jgi:hypothetical protein
LWKEERDNRGKKERDDRIKKERDDQGKKERDNQRKKERDNQRKKERDDRRKNETIEEEERKKQVENLQITVSFFFLVGYFFLSSSWHGGIGLISVVLVVLEGIKGREVVGSRVMR